MSKGAPQVPAPRQPTAGPWRIAGKGTIRAGKHGWVARIYWDNQAANARLIVAAPDMAGMLLDLLEYLDGHSDVVDGDYGQPAPNKAMRLVQEIEGVLAKAGIPSGLPAIAKAESPHQSPKGNPNPV